MEIEKKIIGSCFSYEKCMDQAMDELAKKHFKYYGPVFECMQDFYGKGRDHEDAMFDVQQMLENRGDKENVIDLVNFASPSINEAIEQLKDDWLTRETNKVSEWMYEEIKQGQDAEEIIMSAISQLSELLDGESKDQQTIAEVMNDSVMLIDRLMKGEKLGFTTGLDIDKVLQGIQKGMFYLIAGRPSMGKTAFAIQLAKILAKQAPVGFLSLETTNKSLGLRYIVNHSGIDGGKVRSGSLSDQEYSKILNSAGELSELPIVFDDTADITAEGLRAKISKMKRKHDIEILFIDYVQLMNGKGDTNEQQIAMVSKTCRAVAKEFDIALIGLAQLSRANERRGGDKRPMLSDLRESGQLEQDAFAIMFIHRPEYYGIEQYPSGDSTHGIAEIIIAKHKDGPTGMKKLHFKKETMRFANLIQTQEPAF